MSLKEIHYREGENSHLKRKLRAKLVAAAAAILCLFALAGTAFGFGAGAKGPDVYAVQGVLKSFGYYAGTIDGVCGSMTASGVRAFQEKYGPPITGAVDDKTLKNILWAYEKLKTSHPAPTQPPVPKPTPTPAPTPPPSARLTAEERQMADLVNKVRAASGFPALIVDPTLVKTARLKSKDMVDNHYFSHQSPTYGSPFDMMKQFGVSYTAAGENIACNRSVSATHRALMNSQGHRENILNKAFSRLGIGIVNGGSCGKMFTQLFVGK